ncbi:DUF6177 family protein [Kribbella sp. NPDC026611]|uniref:DUF6177 family protein n=1 Tax=Kribbella sp. NPDC026611 TaxID=3154911 RepID=UPI0033DA67D5
MSGLLDQLPGVDAVTTKAIVMLQDRPVVSMSNWLLTAAIAAEETNRQLQIVTPPTARITHAVRTQLRALWVVKGNEEVYDGLTGRRLIWDGDQFVPNTDTPTLSREWLKPLDGPPQACLQLVARVRYPAAEQTVVGGATEYLLEELTGEPPAGWGTEEPATQLWDTKELTHFCRRWAPRRTMLVVAGKQANGTVEIAVRPAGLEELVTVAIGYQSADTPLPEAIFPVVRRLADDFDLVSLLLIGVGTTNDTTTPARYTGLPDPVALAIGGDGRAAMGPEADRAIAAGAATSIGHDTGLWFPLGTGHTVPDWQTYAGIMRRITAATVHYSANPTPPRLSFTMPS